MDFRRTNGLFNKYVSSDFVQKVIQTLATKILLMGIGLITTVMIARILGPEGRGLYAVAVAVGAMGAQFGNLGLHASNTYYAAKNKTILPALVGNSLFVSFVVGSFIAALVWTFFYFFPQIAPVKGILLALALGYIPFSLGYLLLNNLLLGIGEITSFNAIEIANRTLVVILLFVIIYMNFIRVEVVFFISFFGILCGLILSYIKLKPQFGKKINICLDNFKTSIIYGGKAYFAALFVFLISQTNLLIVQYTSGPADTGYYSIALMMANLLYTVPVSIGMILFPRLSAIDDEIEKWQKAKKVAIYTGLLMCGLSLIAWIFAKPAILILFGHEFLPSLPAFLWLLPGYIIYSVNTILNNYFASKGMPMVVVYSSFCGLIVGIISALFLLEIFDKYYYVSISFIFVSVTMIIFSILEIQKKRKV